MIFLMCCWICLLEFSWGVLHLCLSVICAYNYVFNDVFVWFWNQGDGGFVGCFWKCSILRNFLKEFQKNRHYLFSNLLGQFTCESICPWDFVFWEIFDHSFCFSVCNLLAHNFYFFLVQSWMGELFKESVHFFQVVHFIGIVSCSSLL